MIDYSPDVMTESQSWFANQTSYITGTPAMVADYLTLASLAPALAPTPTPTPGGGGGGGASTTGKNVADDATQSARPFFLFFFLVFGTADVKSMNLSAKVVCQHKISTALVNQGPSIR